MKTKTVRKFDRADGTVWGEFQDGTPEFEQEIDRLARILECADESLRDQLRRGMAVRTEGYSYSMEE
jgi:hypothetical protein